MCSSITRQLEQVAEAISGRGGVCTCDGQGSVRMVRFVSAGDPPDEPDAAGEPVPTCPVHRRRLRFERFDRVKGEWVECDLKDGRSMNCQPGS